jgi:hypothetical protein
MARTAPRVIWLAGLTALVVVVSACGSSGSSTASAKSSATTTPTTASNVIVEPSGVRIVKGSANGSSPCEKAAPTPSSPGELGGGTGSNSNVTDAAGVAAEEHGARGQVVPNALTAAQQTALNQQLAAATAVTKEFPTVKQAVAAGYMESTPYVPCIGAHYTNITLAGSFDPSKPAELLYDGTSPDSKIVGLSYLVFHHLSPPPGFAGSNDLWHQHNANGGLCLKGGFVIGSESTSRQQCAAMGGRKTLLTDVWMLHAWVVPGFSCSWGVFSGECPALGGELCGNSSEAPDPSSTSQCGKAAAQSFGS